MKSILLVCLLTTALNLNAKSHNDFTLHKHHKPMSTKDTLSKAGTATFASVGDDPATCDFDNIQAAITSGVDEVRIQKSLTFSENLNIYNQSVKIIGGYTTCTHANNNNNPSTAATIIDGNNTLPTVIVNNDNSEYEITFKNVWLQNGNSGAINLGGGLQATGEQTSVNIENTRVINNTGSGINAEGIQQLIIKDSYISYNNAVLGGGIACSDTYVYVYGKSEIRGNSASLAGGGVYAFNHCNFSLFSGQPFPGTGSNGITFNETPGEGGGIYAQSGSVINLTGAVIDYGNGNVFGDATRAVKISHNDADSNGGGLYLSDTNTQANLTGVTFQGNESINGNGGAISVHDTATLVVKRFDMPCWSDIKCNFFSFNQTNTTSTGGGIYAEANSTVAIANSYFEKNTASDGSAIWIIDESTAILEGNVFTGNNPRNGRLGSHVLGAENNSELTMGFNTFVDNLASDSALSLNSSTMTNAGNLFYEGETDPVISQTSSTVTNYCIVSQNITGITGTDITQTTSDPFVDRINQDFHLDTVNGLIAVDRCNTSIYSPVLKDIDHQPRGLDYPVLDIDGPYDVGADELSDLIFANGFE